MMEGQMGNDLEALLDGCVDSAQEMDGGINNFLEKQREGCFRPAPLPPQTWSTLSVLGRRCKSSSLCLFLAPLWNLPTPMAV